MLRAHLFGLPAVGRAQGDPYLGGTAAVMRTLARMKGSRPYKPGEIVPAGDLLHADYLGPALRLQGHEMISTGDGKVLEARLPSVSDNRSALEVHQYLVRTTTGQGISRVIPFDVWTRA